MVRTAAGLPEVEVKLRPQIRGTDLKVLGFTTSVPPGRARQYRACRPGVFLEGDLARVINPPRPAVGSATTTPRSPGRPHNQAWKLWQRCSTARLVPRATRYIPITQCERHQSDCSHYICSSRPLPSSAPAWVKAPRCPTHRLWGR